MTLVHWKNGISGQFNTAADWSTHTVPTANDDVAIVAPGTYTVTVSTTHTIKSLATAKGATLAVTGGPFRITNGAGTSVNAGTIGVAAGAALAIGGAFDNSGRISLTTKGSLFGTSDLVIASSVALSGGGTVSLSGNSAIVAGRQTFPIPFPFPIRLLELLLPPITLTNVDNTIVGAGTIGGNGLRLVNEATIDGNSASAALRLNTGTLQIRNTGLVEGTIENGVVIVSNVSNSGTLEALGQNANLTLDGTVTQSANGIVKTSGSGAHVGLSSATITGGALQIGSESTVESIAGSGPSTISNVAVTGTGTLEANNRSELAVTNSTIATTVGLMSNGNGSVLSIDGTVGALAGTINGGEIEFKGASASNVAFVQGQVGTLKLDASFTGTVSGFGGAVPQSFTNMFVFGDSTVDSGALRYLSPDLPSPPNPGLTNRLQNALANGGTDSPVGVGSMNSQILAADFGLTANTAYTTGGVVGGGGTNYAISGALDAADVGNGTEPGNGGISNINQVGGGIPNPALLSTVAQLETYLNSVGGHADPSALYLISSGANDASYATGNLSSGQQTNYVKAQADTLAAEIEKLSAAGAENILVNPIMNNAGLSATYSTELFQKLDASGIPYIKSDVHAMVQDVFANPTAYGFTSTTDQPGVEGTGTESALIQPIVPNKTFNGWGLWGADTTTQETGVQGNFQYSYLSSPDAEQTHFFADDQHLSAAGQQVQANLDYNLVADDKIDLANLPYVFGNTVASFAGTTASGTLSVSNGTQSANIALLGNYLASAFVTASDGGGGTLVMDQSSSSPPQLLAVTHGS